ncbi:MAG: hypothetical protein LQ347_003155 [Umbilicaria vellea]|nr:MAG: hypothetical protein LQ347_003155 [Umbilicaria vellea]
MLPRSSSGKIPFGNHHERYAMNHAVDPHRTDTVRASINADTTPPPDPLTAPFDFTDWILFPEESDEVQGLSEMDRPPPTKSWRRGLESSTHRPNDPQKLLGSFHLPSQISFVENNCKVRKGEICELAERPGGKVRKIDIAGNSIERSEEETPTPRTPRPQRLPTPDLSENEQDDFWLCCIDPRAAHLDEERCGAFILMQSDVLEMWYVGHTATAQ